MNAIYQIERLPLMTAYDGDSDPRRGALSELSCDVPR